MTDAESPRGASTNTTATPEEEHAVIETALRARARTLERATGYVSVGRLTTFLAGAAALAAGVAQGMIAGTVVGAGLLLAFAALVAAHAKLIEQLEQTLALAETHARHRLRIAGRWMELRTRDDVLDPEHAYARDLDVTGPASLLQRLDVTRTTRGEALLVAWLAAPADVAVIEARQRAVAELAAQVELRCAFEAAGARPSAARGRARDEKLDPEPFVALGSLPSLFEERPWLRPVVHGFPFVSVGLLGLWAAGVVPGAFCVAAPLASLALQLLTRRRANGAFDAVAARRGSAEAFASMLATLEGAHWKSARLRALKDHALIDGRPPSVHLRVLDTWVGYAELRRQFLLHLPANLFLLWDLQCLLRIERWSRRIGAHTSAWFDALAELEALSSLAVLAHQDPDAVFPELAPPGSGLDAEGLVHPLLPPAERVANDVHLAGPGSTLIVTGSNMAGKSTLLRAVGLAACLAYAGGPVTARRVRLPLLRIRASMRAEDSLARGASYFHAELTRLRRVVEHADAQPPVLFLLDELLRGTNAGARHIGARAIVLHLLRRGAMGLVATHDVALADLESGGHIQNAHFTDVLVGGEMRFDYRLRPGVVRTSNALRLLADAGIDVPSGDLAAEDSARPRDPTPMSLPAALDGSR